MGSPGHRPPTRRGRARIALAFAVAIVAGSAAGLGGYTFVYAKGASYLTNDPAACANCHVMDDYHAAWLKGSHRAAATCNDCHTPEGLIPKYAVKASNGFWHSFRFTTGDFPDRIRMRPSNVEVVDAACVKCHADIASDLRLHGEVEPGQACVRCHSQVGHAR
jgi:cytochrome c nitrite reductase small subunit